MSNASIGLDAKLQEYLLDVSLQEPLACAELRNETMTLEYAQMLSSPEQVQLLLLLCKMLDAKKGIEVGTFTGYSSLRLCLGIPALQMICCDVSEEYTNIAVRHWRSAGVADRIDLRLAPAQQTLQGLIDSGQVASFDFAYIDADKSRYRDYVAACLQLLRSGGLLAIDNVLWGGSVVDEDDQSEDTLAIRRLNVWLKTRAGEDFDLSMLPIGDGLTILRKF